MTAERTRRTTLRLHSRSDLNVWASSEVLLLDGQNVMRARTQSVSDIKGQDYQGIEASAHLDPI
jgi:hypothetical protein